MLFVSITCLFHFHIQSYAGDKINSSELIVLSFFNLALFSKYFQICSVYILLADEV